MRTCCDLFWWVWTHQLPSDTRGSLCERCILQNSWTKLPENHFILWYLSFWMSTATSLCVFHVYSACLCRTTRSAARWACQVVLHTWSAWSRRHARWVSGWDSSSQRVCVVITCWPAATKSGWRSGEKLRPITLCWSCSCACWINEKTGQLVDVEEVDQFFDRWERWCWRGLISFSLVSPMMLKRLAGVWIACDHFDSI